MPRQAVDLLLPSLEPSMPSRKQKDLGVRGSAAGVAQLGSCLLAAVAAAYVAPSVLEQPPVVAVGAHAGGVGATRSLP